MNQAVRARYDYDPFGKVTKVSGDRDSDFLFTGFYWHAQSELYLTLYRAYDPELGRWISRDPIAENGGMNLYAYVGNNPIRLIDPLGLDWVDTLRDGSAGLGDGMLWTLTLGQWNGDKVRDALGIAPINKCSSAYQGTNFVGKILPVLAVAAYFAPAVLAEADLWLFTEHAFWSGGVEIEAGIEAAANGAATLEQTAIGQGLKGATNFLIENFGKDVAYKLTGSAWNFASRMWAATAGSTATVYLGQVVRDSSVWMTLEKPMLLSRGVDMVTKYIH